MFEQLIKTIDDLQKKGVTVNLAFDLASSAWVAGALFIAGFFLLLTYFFIKSATKS